MIWTASANKVRSTFSILQQLTSVAQTWAAHRWHQQDTVQLWSNTSHTHVFLFKSRLWQHTYTTVAASLSRTHTHARTHAQTNLKSICTESRWTLDWEQQMNTLTCRSSCIRSFMAAADVSLRHFPLTVCVSVCKRRKMVMMMLVEGSTDTPSWGVESGGGQRRASLPLSLSLSLSWEEGEEIGGGAGDDDEDDGDGGGGTRSQWRSQKGEARPPYR